MLRHDDRFGYGYDMSLSLKPKSEKLESKAELKPGDNRAMRRQLERARRRKDKFVKKKERYARSTEKTQEARPRPTSIEQLPMVEARDPNDYAIYDKHHTDDELVLYEEAELYGEFNFRDTILEQLDRYFVYLRRMKTKRHDDYQLYRQIGATLVPYSRHSKMHSNTPIKTRTKPRPDAPKLPLWFHRERPTFGCIVYGADPFVEAREMNESEPGRHGKRLYVPKFLSITKYRNPPPELELTKGGDVYCMTIWWDRPQDTKSKRKHATEQSYGVFISKDGKQMRVLRCCEPRLIDIYSKRKHEWFAIPSHAYHIPDEFTEWAKDHGEDVQRFLLHLFCDTIEDMEHSEFSMVRVAATKDDMTAIFHVNIRKTAYFFQDRDATVDQRGVKKRIFHMVRSHTRTTAKGEVVVPTSFRGERSFNWAGYHIDISIPVREHMRLNEFNLAVDDASNPNAPKIDKKDAIHTEEIGKMLADLMRPGSESQYRA
jgi:hypothetical protein